ncbi:hypothetical protein K1T71_013165 [Dendrolimus kikuchii]|uniref:Uncharacterized protein n=1 Tax=Dendrolimus kikuchii TaxID=765133 RepID=A0ACC1CJ78_9NEOP|nr:hypothetical protein K1T71_013165 [Dendrolimus kikuchii]
MFLEALSERIGSIETDRNLDINYHETYLMCEKIIDAYNVHTKSFRCLQSTVFTFIMFFSWQIRNVILQITLSLESERLYIANDNMITVCYLNIASQEEKEQRMCIRKILRLSKTGFHKFNACGLFDVDAGLSLQLFSTLTTYIIVLLQFEFL